MGIYDRDYYRDERGRRGAPGGLGGLAGGAGFMRLRFLSFNAWIIIACTAVFLLDMTLASQGVPVYQQSSRSERVPLDREVYESTPQGEQIFLYVGQGGRTARVERSDLNANMRAVSSHVYDRQTGNRIGSDLFFVMTPIQAYGHFSTAKGFFGLEVWRLISFQFLHANFTHLFFNMFGMFIFGGMVERQLGFKRYAAFYLVCGICGGIAYLSLNFIGSVLGVQLPGVLIDRTTMPLVGASAGVFGIIMACAYFYPKAEVLLFGIVPLTIRTLAYAYVIFAGINLFRSGPNAGGDAAHLGGAIAGYFFIRNLHLLRDFFDIFGNSSKPKDGRPPKSGRTRGKPKDIDRILDKVNQEGLASLSEREKRLLRSASEESRGGQD